MAEISQIPLLTPAEVTQRAPVRQAANGICFADYGETSVAIEDLERVVEAVPAVIARALARRAYYFVPLVINDEEAPSIAAGYSSDLADRAVCHRDATLGGSECVFISTRLMQDRFALAFEYFINVGHHFVEAVGVPQSFADQVWAQVQAGVRGETSQDAWENRRRALSRDAVDEKAKSAYFETAFSDAVAIYLLTLTLDFDYAELKEREYPLLAAHALAERLRHVAGLFPPNQGYEFEIRYRRRG